MHNHSDQEIEEEDQIKPLMIPKQAKDLKACSTCGILLNSAQWKEKEEQCPNGCSGPLTKSYSGMVCVMKPRESWVTRRLASGREDIYPGMYAAEVQET
ncbi:Transcription elongation factor SPT4 [Paramecium bursaria]